MGQIFEAIKAFGRGAVFVPTDFLDFGSREAVDVVLHRLVRKGTIRRLARGIYGQKCLMHCGSVLGVEAFM